MVPVSRADVTEKAGGAGGESHRLRGWWFFCVLAGGFAGRKKPAAAGQLPAWVSGLRGGPEWVRR